MKATKILVLLLFINIGIAVIPQNVSAQYASVSFQVFYDELSPYGMWADYPVYGYVWIPNYGHGFYPYATNGYWAYTAFGWTWVSLYPWGWAPFHYGRWFHDDLYGWIWIPGTEWGPAWVVWRGGGGYYGWAPLMPGFGISVTNYNISHNHWVFVNQNDFGKPDIQTYYGPREHNDALVNNSKVITNTYKDKSRNTSYITGPNKKEVQKLSGRTVEQISINESDKPLQKMDNNKLTLYRPIVEKHSKGEKPTPSITNLKDVKPEKERKEIVQPEEEKRPKREIKKEPVPQRKLTEPIIKDREKTEPVKSTKKRETIPEKEKQPSIKEQETPPQPEKISPPAEHRQPVLQEKPPDINREPQRAPEKIILPKEPKQQHVPGQEKPQIKREIQPKPVKQQPNPGKPEKTKPR